MNLYIAGLYTGHYARHSRINLSTTPNAQLLRNSVTHHLESYHYIGKGRKYIEAIQRDGVKVFLDSGAFSSFSLGVEVDIRAYAEFVKDNQDIIEMASVLDAIGDHEGTLRNQNELERLGAQVLPCFHYGEPWDLCEYYVRNYPYMTIGGMVPIHNQKLEPWLDELWEKVLTDKDGYARNKVHGFGLTSRDLMVKYPWYSVDSSSWVQAAVNGSIVLPEINSAISISNRSPSRKDFGRHFDTLAPQAKDYIVRILEYYGLTLEEVQEDYRYRWALNCFSYDRVGKMLSDDHWRKPFRAKQNVLF